MEFFKYIIILFENRGDFVLIYLFNGFSYFFFLIVWTNIFNIVLNSSGDRGYFCFIYYDSEKCCSIFLLILIEIDVLSNFEGVRGLEFV